MGIVGTTIAGMALPTATSSPLPVGGAYTNGVPSWPSAMAPGIGEYTKAMSYAWWITFFELIMIIGSFVVITSKPEYRYGLTGLLAVLTATTFFYTSEIFNAPAGIYALTHTTDYKMIVRAHPRRPGASQSLHCALLPCACDVT